MNEKRKDDIYYVCTMIEFVARATKNRRRDVVKNFSVKNIEHQLKVAEVNHCLSFEQVSEEWVEQYDIEMGNYDTVSECKYAVPSVTAIGRVYQQLVLAILYLHYSLQSLLASLQHVLSTVTEPIVSLVPIS